MARSNVCIWKCCSSTSFLMLSPNSAISALCPFIRTRESERREATPDPRGARAFAGWGRRWPPESRSPSEGSATTPDLRPSRDARARSSVEAAGGRRKGAPRPEGERPHRICAWSRTRARSSGEAVVRRREGATRPGRSPCPVLSDRSTMKGERFGSGYICVYICIYMYTDS